MTGKDLMIYILTNNLEDLSIEDILAKTFLTEEQAAVKLKVGVETVRTMFNLNVLPGIKIGESIYIFADYDKRIVSEGCE